MSNRGPLHTKRHNWSTKCCAHQDLRNNRIFSSQIWLSSWTVSNVLFVHWSFQYTTFPDKIQTLFRGCTRRNCVLILEHLKHSSHSRAVFSPFLNWDGHHINCCPLLLWPVTDCTSEWGFRMGHLGWWQTIRGLRHFLLLLKCAVI
jgi:hypothetical protein